MTAEAIEVPYGPRRGTRYAADMARTELMGLDAARKSLGERVDMARDHEIHTVMTRHGQPAAVLVDIRYYLKSRTAVGDPTDLAVVPPPPPKEKSDAVPSDDAASA